ncbi:polynucleotide adenylyltransferase PcnB [Salinispira pacifica]
MLVRYKTTEDGSAAKQAEIYVADEHKLAPQEVDSDALKIIRRLRGAGHSAYVVGGAVRDLLLRKKPKDYDIVTDAAPGRIRKLFRNSRVIGKRFRLVHIFFGEKIIEVSTFRAEISAGFMNVYGEIEEDVKRRDFTVNSLYYDPEENTILDYTGGFRDVRARKLKPVIPLDKIFAEDPVRMIRAVKYCAGGGLKMGFRLKQQLKRSVSGLGETPASRMTEELFKILGSGRAREMFSECERFGMLRYMLPVTEELFRSNRAYRDAFYRMMALLDELVQAGEARKARFMAYLCAPYLYHVSELGGADRIAFRETFAELKTAIRPMVPANRDIEQALVHLIRRRKVYRKHGTLERPDGSEDEDDHIRPHRKKHSQQQRGRQGGTHTAGAPHQAGSRPSGTQHAADGSSSHRGRSRRRRRPRPEQHPETPESPRNNADRDG